MPHYLLMFSTLPLESLDKCCGNFHLNFLGSDNCGNFAKEAGGRLENFRINTIFIAYLNTHII